MFHLVKNFEKRTKITELIQRQSEMMPIDRQFKCTSFQDLEQLYFRMLFLFAIYSCNRGVNRVSSLGVRLNFSYLVNNYNRF